MRGETKFTALLNEKQASLLKEFKAVSDSIGSQKRIAMIRDLRRRFEEQDYSRLLAQLDVTEQSNNAKQPEPPKLVAARSIAIPFDKAWLADEVDLDRYLNALRQEWLKEIQAGKRVQV